MSVLSWNLLLPKIAMGSRLQSQRFHALLPCLVWPPLLLLLLVHSWCVMPHRGRSLDGLSYASAGSYGRRHGSRVSKKCQRKLSCQAGTQGRGFAAQQCSGLEGCQDAASEERCMEATTKAVGVGSAFRAAHWTPNYAMSLRTLFVSDIAQTEAFPELGCPAAVSRPSQNPTLSTQPHSHSPIFLDFIQLI
ncbi:hypothetical protein B0T09DRAFT_10095 [Sordaria sp. MPI-SDFR-AT-0083]|nr:hypothetical protein B0T09DRAFT_10095 [Sordaria sp. MPI-SDFR-AT-0083]